jgi:lipopolysaccharide transport system permease protein
LKAERKTGKIFPEDMRQKVPREALTVVYGPGSQLREPGRLFRCMLRDLAASRELAWRLFVRNVSARYRQTMLGYAWAILPPVFTTLVFVFLRNAGFFAVGQTQLPYGLFLFTGMVLWQTFSDALGSPMRMVTQSASMLTRVNFPREALILAGIGEVLFNFLIRLALLIVVILWSGLQLPWTVILVPFGVLTLVALGIAIGVLFTPFAVLFQDVGHGLPFLASLWMFLTPVLYPAPNAGPGSLTMMLNPVSPVLDTTRAWLLTGSPEYFMGFLGVSFMTAAALLCSWGLYRLALPILIERMGA